MSIQARMASARLPGKVLAPMFGRPLLAHQIERLALVGAPIVVATTTLPEDDAIAELAEDLGVGYVRGPRDDLLTRHHMAATVADAEAVLITGADDPLIDPADVRLAFDRFAVGDCDYVITTGRPLGLMVWVVGADALAEAADTSSDPDERRETVPWWDHRPERYRTVLIPLPGGDYRLTVDTPADLDLHRLLYANLPDEFTTDDILELLAAHPDWAMINADVVQEYDWERDH